MFFLNLLKRVRFQTRHLNKPELCPDLLQCFRILFVCLPSLLFIIAISPTKPLSPVESVGLCLPFWVQLQPNAGRSGDRRITVGIIYIPIKAMIFIVQDTVLYGAIWVGFYVWQILLREKIVCGICWSNYSMFSNHFIGYQLKTGQK